MALPESRKESSSSSSLSLPLLAALYSTAPPPPAVSLDRGRFDDSARYERGGCAYLRVRPGFTQTYDAQQSDRGKSCPSVPQLRIPFRRILASSRSLARTHARTHARSLASSSSSLAVAPPGREEENEENGENEWRVGDRKLNGQFPSRRSIGGRGRGIRELELEPDFRRSFPRVGIAKRARRAKEEEKQKRREAWRRGHINGSFSKCVRVIKCVVRACARARPTGACTALDNNSTLQAIVARTRDRSRVFPSNLPCAFHADIKSP